MFTIYQRCYSFFRHNFNLLKAKLLYFHQGVVLKTNTKKIINRASHTALENINLVKLNAKRSSTSMCIIIHVLVKLVPHLHIESKFWFAESPQKSKLNLHVW